MVTHSEVRNALGGNAAMAYRLVVREPVVREADDLRSLCLECRTWCQRGMGAADGGFV